jgi:hypothetical protein
MTKRTTLISALLLAFTLTLAASTAEAQRNDYARLRFGISGVGGGFVGAAHGGMGGAEVRVGLQLNNVFAIYVQGQGLIGQFLPAPGDGLAGFAFHSLMFEVTVGDTFQFGAGPSLDVIWGCDDRYQRACASNGPYAGGNFRFGILVDEHIRHRRSGFVVSFEAHPTWFGDQASVSLLLGLGYEAN